MPSRTDLIDQQHCCLVVIDVQQHFLDKLAPGDAHPLVGRIGWLMAVARHLGIPVIATAEDVANDGPMVTALSARLTPGSIVHDKLYFGLHQQAGILSDLEITGRSTMVLCGLETDVCVAHSALGLAQLGYDVVVIADACGSPAADHEAGLARLRGAGITVTTVKGVFYEWVRGVAHYHELMTALEADLPDGLVL